MRTTITITYEDGRVQTEVCGSGRISNDIRRLLGLEGLDYLELVRKDGRRIRYTAWEFGCKWCEQYGHEVADCGLFMEQSKEEQEAFLVQDRKRY